MRVSVIVPVFNGERYVAAALQSIFAQDYGPLEVIVVDDGSTDGTAAVVGGFPEVHYLHQANQGASVARNRGVAASHGDILAFLDADDMWQPGKLRTQMAWFDNTPGGGLTYGFLQNFVQDGTPDTMVDPILHPVGRLDPAFTPSTLAVRRDVWDQIGPFDPDLRLSEDTDWLVRAMEHGIPMAQLADVILLRRIHDQNISHEFKSGRNDAVMKLVRASLRRKRMT